MELIRPGMPWSVSTSAGLHHLICQVAEHWPGVQPLLHVPASEADYDLLVVSLVELKGIIGRQAAHPLMSLVAVVEVLMHYYEGGRKI
ncbi:MAG: hypothetical protein K2Y25_01885 [Pseudomonadaceae bacterium]|jgi:hypothetical protein|nr:hypothetical protein [Pseudomonadaceae bacterium]